MIKGRHYRPQSQWKVERRNRIIGAKIKFEAIRKQHKYGFNWIQTLSEIAYIINGQPKEVVGYQTPFDVNFGRGENASADFIRQKAATATKGV